MLLSWLEGANVIDFAKDVGIGLTFWHVSDGGFASVAELERALELPELDASVMYKIDRLGLSFWAATQIDDGPLALKPLERQRVRMWLERCYSQFEALAPAI